MREELLHILRCPSCQSSNLTLRAYSRNHQEIREGDVVCQSCQHGIPIRKGVVRVLYQPDTEIAGEAQGWVTLLDRPVNAHEFQDEWIVTLPFIRSEQRNSAEAIRIWHRLGENFFSCLQHLNWKNKRVLEIGAGRCWGLAELARRGASAVGLDIVTQKYIGLETADVWFERQNVFFERIVGDMHHLPFCAQTFDVVLTNASLHHTRRLERVLGETGRVLKPDGYALFINEPEVPTGHPKPDMRHSPECRHGIIETCPSYGEWMTAFTNTGFSVENIWFKHGMHVLLSKSPRLRADYAEARNTLWGNVMHEFPRKYASLRRWGKATRYYAPATLRYYWQQMKYGINRMKKK